MIAPRVIGAIFTPRLRITLRAGTVLWVPGVSCIHAYHPAGAWLGTWFPKPGEHWTQPAIISYVEWLNERETRPRP